MKFCKIATSGFMVLKSFLLVLEKQQSEQFIQYNIFLNRRFLSTRKKNRTRKLYDSKDLIWLNDFHVRVISQ